ncbi:hypothetical protein VNI00_008721 [Paramarasmius palmivorus]|uniref:NACHT domain-containing protein n=1 Tax=Paramarasmius palmivorus TaxID=297713 RepID=A0AAW0CVC4_9AGAR
MHYSEQRSPPPNCHPGTRTEVLKSLGYWIQWKSTTKKIRVQWLSGPAGVGKSAIAQNLAEKYAGSGLAASFFFSRNDPSRNRVDPLVATITYQLVTTNHLKDLIGPIVFDAIRSNPNIFHSSFENQFRKLILEPSSKIDPVEWKKLPWLIIIDGLDELIDITSQERLLAVIREVTTLPSPIAFIFLLCSRPEPRIRYAFDHGAFGSVLGRISIGDTPESNRDIEVFLRDMFAILREKHAYSLRHTEPSWPGDDVIHQLVQKASGQFIFVTTVMKYLDCDDDLPSKRLDTILGSNLIELVDSPYPELDQLYNQLLSSCSNWPATSHVLRLIVTPHTQPIVSGEQVAWRSARVIEGILKLRPGQLGARLAKLHSVIHVPDDPDSNIHILHASFTEFMLGRHRSGKYHIEQFTTDEYWDRISQFLLRTHSLLPFPPYSTWNALHDTISSWDALLESYQSGLNQLIIFSCLSWDDFLYRINPSQELLETLDKFDPYHVLTMILHYRARRRIAHDMFFVDWEFAMGWNQCLTWAKSLGERTPRKFVETLETFYRGFCIGFHPKTSQYWAYASSVLESYLYLKSSHTRYFYENMYLGDRLNPPSHAIDPYPNPFPFIIPAGTLPVLPYDWNIVEATRTEAEDFHNLLLTLAPNEDTQKLIQDVLNDTQESVSSDKTDELKRLKKIVLKHKRVANFLPPIVAPLETPGSAQVQARTDALASAVALLDVAGQQLDGSRN